MGGALVGATEGGAGGGTEYCCCDDVGEIGLLELACKVEPDGDPDLLPDGRFGGDQLPVNCSPVMNGCNLAC